MALRYHINARGRLVALEKFVGAARHLPKIKQLAVTVLYLVMTVIHLAVTILYLAVTALHLAVTSLYLAVTVLYLARTVLHVPNSRGRLVALEKFV